jgi:hypothetical protein
MTEYEHQEKFRDDMEALPKEIQTAFREKLEKDFMDEMINGIMSWEILRSMLKSFVERKK